MRSTFAGSALATALALFAATLAASAQTPPAPAPAVAAKPKQPAAAPPARPAAQTPADTARAMAQAERVAIQSDLAWAGVYNGGINGEVSERMVTAIKAWQKDRGGAQTGVLNPQERAALAAAAKTRQDAVGWRVAADPVNGIRLGVPTRLAPTMSAGATGSKWSSAQGQVQIETWRLRDAGLTLAAVAEREAKEPAGRKIGYRTLNQEFFVLSGLQGLKRFYVRGQIRGGEVRGLTILYDQATEGTMEPVVIAMSSAFAPFPAAAAPVAGPPPRRPVEYSTGVVVGADGFILADRMAVDGCVAIVVPGHGNADRIAEDKTRDLALLRIWGASGLKPLAFPAGAAKSDIVLTGIADPQSQGGGAKVGAARAQIGAGPSGDNLLTPPPGLGFSGAIALDADGKFAGIAQLRTVMVAAAQPPPAPPPPSPAAKGAPAAATPAAAPAAPTLVATPQATLASAEGVRAFLAANGVRPATGLADPKASVLRVICVRK